jgi:hypothetical protein
MCLWNLESPEEEDTSENVIHITHIFHNTLYVLKIDCHTAIVWVQVFLRYMLLAFTGQKMEAVGSCRTGAYLTVYTELLPKRTQ